MYVKRSLETSIQQVNEQFPVLLVTGPRQVGKTTCLRHVSEENRNYVTLDDPILATLAKEEPKLFLERFTPPVLIDKIQYAPELLPYIKIEVDDKNIPGQFWLTGSQQFQLMKDISKTLAGRVGIINLLGLSQQELREKAESDTPFLPIEETLGIRQKSMQKQSLSDIYFRIWRGFFPAIALNEEIDHSLFYSSYVQTYLQRDIHDLTRVGDEIAFLRFLRAIAARTGQLLNIAELARDADISPNTAKNWLSILKASGIIYLLEPYFTNVTKRIIKAPKLYFLDTGLCAYLTQWSSPETLEAGAMSGAILETFVVTEILKSYWHNGKQAPFYYYRDKDKKEIDLLICHDRMIYPIEIKKTASPNKNDVKHFSVLEKFGRIVGHGAIICLVDQLIPISDQATAIPVFFV